MELLLVSSLEKVFPDIRPRVWASPSLTLLKNQRGSFQLAYRSEKEDSFTLTVSGISGLCCKEVCLVPSDYPCHETVDNLYLRTQPGLYPDLLKPISLAQPVKAPAGEFHSLWFTVENQEPGNYLIQLKVCADGQEQVLNLPLTILPRELPPQTLLHTEWFHGDCLADYYQVPVFSEPHWQALEGFLAAAARCGVNMILTPVFTPPLDTAKGGERTTIQLVDVYFSEGAYHFNFAKLRRWISLCRKYGITELEISHLFTQWGAIAAPKVMVTEDGVLKKKFGWHTPAIGGEYTAFLRSFLPALKEELEGLGIWEHTWFHISDEPSEEQKDDYEAAKNSIRDLLPDGRIIDALSSFEFYRHGIVEKPVVCEDHIEPFAEAEIPGLWTYYCTAQSLEVPNRFFSMPSGRNRILGVLLYVYNLEGFLHWGFNFYNSQFSLKHIDPYTVTDAGGAFPSGDAFLVYPAPDMRAYDSIRSEVLFDALQDLRLLRLAETTAGRENILHEVTALAGAPVTFTCYPTEDSFFEKLHQRLLELI